MVNGARIAAAGLLAFGAWLYVQRQRQEEAEIEAEADTAETWLTTAETWLTTADDALTGATETAAEFIDSITGGIMKISAMARVNPLDLNNRNVQAMLRVIRRGEGTDDEGGYRRIFGGGTFESYADHPRVPVTRTFRNGLTVTSTAAGAYQFLASTWDETRRLMNLPDFSPRSQDLAALGRIVARGALEDVKAGRFETAVRKLAREWASLPGSPYGQPTISWETARQVFAAAGGVQDKMTA